MVSNMASRDAGETAKRHLLRRLVGPALGTLFLFVVLIGLGAWQVERLGWKNRLVAAIDQANERDPVQLSSTPRPFEKVEVAGRWLASVARYGAEVRDTRSGPRMGSQLVGVLSRPGSPAVLVLLGWVVDGVSVKLPTGEVRVVGYVRPLEHQGWLSAGDNTTTARFFTLNPLVIGKALSVDVEPFTVVSLLPGTGSVVYSGLEPIPADQLPRPLNNHLSYAATWFGLAATLLVVFGIWVRRQLSE